MSDNSRAAYPHLRRSAWIRHSLRLRGAPAGRLFRPGGGAAVASQ